MQIIVIGPGLAELRRKLGTGEPVTFGEGRDALTGTVNSLTAVGSWDTPVELPGSISNPASRWIVGGDTVHDDHSFAVLVGMTDNGRFVVGAVVKELDEKDTTLAIGLHLLRAFGRAAKASIDGMVIMHYLSRPAPARHSIHHRVPLGHSIYVTKPYFYDIIY